MIQSRIVLTTTESYQMSGGQILGVIFALILILGIAMAAIIHSQNKPRRRPPGSR